ncbi:MAG TPA: DinB family protein [Gemmatimonadales bacterium]|jgi:uncharacterized damage-inducible protein DinB
MVSLAFAVLLAWSSAETAAPAPPSTLKGVLLEQLQSTHDKEQWFAPSSVAVGGITAEQANWHDGKGNHSIGQLAAHLVFWNRQQLAKFRGEKPPAYSGDNNETFNSFDPAKWAATVHDLDEVMKAWEDAVQKADDKKLASWASTIAHVGAHNAYHIGQMVYIRKLQGSWDPEKGVK